MWRMRTAHAYTDVPMSEIVPSFGALPRTTGREGSPVVVGATSRPGASRVAPRVGLVSNPRSHRNRIAAGGQPVRDDVLSAVPRTRDDLRRALAEFADRGVDLLVVNGGDGTVRDVLSCAGELWDAAWPRIAVLPAGKTNALALDLGIPPGWTLDQAIEAARRGAFVRRSPLEFERRDARSPVLRGFLFGAGAFLRGTELAQATHRAGAFRGVAVGLALGWAITQTLFGAASSVWRRGDAIRIDYAPGTRFLHDRAVESDGERYILFASTLTRLPIGLKPFGRERPGLKTLVIDAPPRRLAVAVGPLIAGSEARWLSDAGYHRADTDRLDVSLRADFVLDGESFAAGDYTIRNGPALSFVVP